MSLNRGDINMAVALFVFFGTLAMAALMFILLDQAYEPIFSMANTSAAANNTTRLNDGINRANDWWNNWPYFVLALSAILGLATAALSSGRGL